MNKSSEPNPTLLIHFHLMSVNFQQPRRHDLLSWDLKFPEGIALS